MFYQFVLEGLLVSIPMVIFIYFVLQWVATRPQLLQEVNPNTGQVGPIYTCRGGWNEGEIRGCAQGYAATGIPVEPVNTYSNIAYLVAGWVVFKEIGSDSSIVFLVAMTFLCFGSAIYHGIKSRWSARWDHGGMYAVFGALAFYAMAHDHSYETWIMLGGSILFGVALAWILDGNLIARMGVLLIIILVGAVTSGTATLAWYSLGFFLLAMAIWLIDVNTMVLGRWGHGIWHLFTATALGILFVAI